MRRSSQLPLTSLCLLGLALLSISTGCCITRPYGGCGWGACNTCASPCDTCSPCAAPAASCAPLGPRFPASCGTCQRGPCGGFSGMCLPLLSSRLSCGSGCGAVYWNEWMSDPPECDPCDGCGNYTGHCGCDSAWNGPVGCGPGKVVGGAFRGVTGVVGGVLHTVLYGYRGSCNGTCGWNSCTSCVAPTDCAAPACSACGGGGCSSCGAQVATTADEMVAATVAPQSVQPAMAQRVATHPPINRRLPHRVVTQRLRQ